jgi:prepilin-type N-terminal cleavage/methylation domain-containing protein/prepilin-type processing-associated H-X9-DG protein
MHASKNPIVACPPRGFTLVELLVTITIIVVLASIGMMTFSRVRESARSSVCMANLRQIGSATLLYAGEHSSALPFSVSGDPSDPSSHSSIWQSDLDSYLPYPQGNANGGQGDLNVPAAVSPWHCPSADAMRKWSGAEPDYGCLERPQDGAGRKGVFARNAWGTHLPAVRLASISSPERCMMVADACTTRGVRDGTWTLSGSLNVSSLNISASVPSSGLAPRHGYDGKDSRSGKFNAVFCDGHVESISYGDPRLKDSNFLKALLAPY